MNTDLRGAMGHALARAKAVEKTWIASPNPAVARNKAKHPMAGYGYLLIAMRFMRWAIEQEQFPTVGAVMTHFNVSKATAYRWTAAYAEACGIDPHNRHGGLPV
ncbi:hypothetical protein [Pseudoxanthomonas winnipegensis]|nr:hypothetical protein [Pseudoxanthomonas winnipegensis]